MSRPISIPKLTHHKASGKAVVRLSGVDVYCGLFGTSEAENAYDRAISEWLARGRAQDMRRAPLGGAEESPGLSVNELLLAFWKHAEQHYRRPDGTPTNEINEYRQTLRLVKDHYGTTSAVEFGPVALKAVRQAMINRGWCRGLINQRVNRVRRVFKWGAGDELIFIDIDEAKTAAKCLVELNLFEDAQELAEAWIRLHKWAVGSVMNEVLSAITSSDPERQKSYRELFGDFPTQAELEANSHERRKTAFLAVSQARELLKRLRQVEDAVSDDTITPIMKNAGPRGTTKTARAIAMMRTRPELNDKEVAEAVGCDPSTLSGSLVYQAARRAFAAEQAKRLNRSRRHRGNDMDKYSDDPDS